MSEQRLCRDCGNRSKPVRHGVGWCFLDDVPVPLGVPRACTSFVPRGKKPLQEPPAIPGLERTVASNRQD